MYACMLLACMVVALHDWGQVRQEGSGSDSANDEDRLPDFDHDAGKQAIEGYDWSVCKSIDATHRNRATYQNPEPDRAANQDEVQNSRIVLFGADFVHSASSFDTPTHDSPDSLPALQHNSTTPVNSQINVAANPENQETDAPGPQLAADQDEQQDAMPVDAASDDLDSTDTSHDIPTHDSSDALSAFQRNSTTPVNSEVNVAGRGQPPVRKYTGEPKGLGTIQQRFKIVIKRLLSKGTIKLIDIEGTPDGYKCIAIDPAAFIYELAKQAKLLPEADAVYLVQKLVDPTYGGVTTDRRDYITLNKNMKQKDEKDKRLKASWMRKKREILPRNHRHWDSVLGRASSRRAESPAIWRELVWMLANYYLQ